MSDDDRSRSVNLLQLLALDVRSGRARVAFYNEPCRATVEPDGALAPGKVRIRIQVEYDE